MPKIVHLTTVHTASDVRIFHKQAKTLVRVGYDVTLIAQHNKDEVVDGVKIVALPKPRNRFVRIFKLTWQAFKLALRQRAHIYPFHDPEFLPISLLLKIFTQGKIIYDVHEDVSKDILTKEWIPPFARKPLARLARFVEKQIAYRLDAIVLAGETIALSPRKSKLTVVHNYPSLSALAKTDLSREEQSDFILLYMGGITRLRGAVEMVRALEHISSDLKIRLELIGKFEPPHLEAELQALRGYKRVRFLGWLPWESALKCSQRAHIGLVLLHPTPAHINSLPIKMFEYMAVGLPIIASNFPLWKEIVEGNKCGLTVDPLNPKEIAQAIEYLLEHPELRQEMGENGRRAVIEKYNWEQEAEKLLALYQRLLERAQDSEH